MSDVNANHAVSSGQIQGAPNASINVFVPAAPLCVLKCFPPGIITEIGFMPLIFFNVVFPCSPFYLVCNAVVVTL